jgi:hypothetical protein
MVIHWYWQSTENAEQFSTAGEPKDQGKPTLTKR